MDRFDMIICGLLSVGAAIGIVTILYMSYLAVLAIAASVRKFFTAGE